MIVEKMAKDMRVPVAHIKMLAVTASHRYKVYRIAKRTHGTRQISHPSIEIKALQRWLVRNALSKLPVHEAVFSYREGIGIRDHADVHKRNSYLLRVDLKDFFPSITADDVARLLYQNRQKLPSGITATDMKAICQIVCRNGRLTIGAPSSPLISNAVLYEFDRYWHERCDGKGIAYSRYADDIYLSTNKPDLLAKEYKEIRRYLEELAWPKLRVNTRKVVFTSRKHNRNVTGLILTSDRRVSIGHKKKRWIRSQVFKFANEQLPADAISYLRGYLSYIRAVEPSFIKRLRQKYGADVVRNISGAEAIPRKTTKHA